MYNLRRFVSHILTLKFCQRKKEEKDAEKEANKRQKVDDTNQYPVEDLDLKEATAHPPPEAHETFDPMPLCSVDATLTTWGFLNSFAYGNDSQPSDQGLANYCGSTPLPSTTTSTHSRVIRDRLSFRIFSLPSYGYWWLRTKSTELIKQPSLFVTGRPFSRTFW